MTTQAMTYEITCCYQEYTRVVPGTDLDREVETSLVTAIMTGRDGGRFRETSIRHGQPDRELLCTWSVARGNDGCEVTLELRPEDSPIMDLTSLAVVRFSAGLVRSMTGEICVYLSRPRDVIGPVDVSRCEGHVVDGPYASPRIPLGVHYRD